jgi:hypothetical protein
LAEGCNIVSASGESLACPVNAVSGVCPARCDEGDLLSTACIAGKMHGHSWGAKCISESIALAALRNLSILLTESYASKVWDTCACFTQQWRMCPHKYWIRVRASPILPRSGAHFWDI